MSAYFRLKEDIDFSAINLAVYNLQTENSRVELFSNSLPSERNLRKASWNDNILLAIILG